MIQNLKKVNLFQTKDIQNLTMNINKLQSKDFNGVIHSIEKVKQIANKLIAFKELNHELTIETQVKSKLVEKQKSQIKELIAGNKLCQSKLLNLTNFKNIAYERISKQKQSLEENTELIQSITKENLKMKMKISLIKKRS